VGLYVLIINPTWVVGLLIIRNVYLAIFSRPTEDVEWESVE